MNEQCGHHSVSSRTPAPSEVRAVARERIAQIRQSLTKEQSA